MGLPAPRGRTGLEEDAMHTTNRTARLPAAGALASLLLAGGALWAGLGAALRNWGAAPHERGRWLPGDELVPAPYAQRTKALTIRAPAARIWPWLLQLGQERGGFYSYTWLENLLGCRIRNADRIVPEWQTLAPGDLVRMYPRDRQGPPPYEVAAAAPERTLVLGHRRADLPGWADSWQFVLEPLDPGRTRLLLRARNIDLGPLWVALEPGFSLMERGMLLGLRARAER